LQAITREYGRQKQFLQQKVDEAKVQLRQESTDAANVMRKLTEENLSLIEEVKGLRKEVVAAKARRAQVKARPKSQKGTSAALVVAEPGSGSTARIGQVEVLIASQRDEIGSLKAEVRRLEGLLASVRPL
jgi:cell division protein FtsB